MNFPGDPKGPPPHLMHTFVLGMLASKLQHALAPEDRVVSMSVTCVLPGPRLAVYSVSPAAPDVSVMMITDPAALFEALNAHEGIMSEHVIDASPDHLPEDL